MLLASGARRLETRHKEEERRLEADGEALNDGGDDADEPGVKSDGGSSSKSVYKLRNVHGKRSPKSATW